MTTENRKRKREKKKEIVESSEEEEELEDDFDDEENSADLLNTDVEGFPITEEDKEGVTNLVTQIFLRNAEVNIPNLIDDLINQKCGLVLGPAEDEADDENPNIVYGLLTVMQIDVKQEKPASNYASQLVNYILERANKYALKEKFGHFKEVLSHNFAFLINERMLHFPDAVVPHSFSSLRDELSNMKMPKFNHILYIQKIRVVEEETKNSDSFNQSQQKKKKGKAEKKRQAVEALSKAEMFYDNAEDAALFQISAGNVDYFDYPVHQDVEAGSKFHIIERDGKKYRPYRRAILMDIERFNNFVDAMTQFSG